MKIEFRKIPLKTSEFDVSSNSVKFSGTFSKISSKLAKIDANLNGSCEVDCCKCGKPFTIDLNEKIDFLVSDGIYSDKDEREYIVVEVKEHMLDFDEILYSELESLKAEYHICDICKENDSYVEIEY